MASKSNKILEKIYALTSSKLFLCAMIFSVVAQFCSAFSMSYNAVVSGKTNAESILNILSSVNVVLVAIVVTYGMVMIYRKSKDGEVSSFGCDLVFWSKIIGYSIAAVVIVVRYITQFMSYDDLNFAEMGFSETSLIVIMAVIIIALGVGVPCALETSAIRYFKNININLFLRPQKFKLLFLMEICVFVYSIFMAFSGIFERVEILTSNFSATTVFLLIFITFFRICDIIRVLLFTVLIYKFNKTINPLIKQ